MKRFFLSAFTAITLFSAPMLFADEGMWLPLLISQRFEDMQSKGFQLTPEDIYSVNQASLKDAVVLFGTGCTGELISPEGLLVTNHHCGYSCIQRHSSVEHDYLKDGFWAMNRNEELPNPGMTVSFLDRMEDVTNIILKECTPEMSEKERNRIVYDATKALEKQVSDPAHGVKAKVEALYHRNKYYLFVYRIYRDIRLVGAPPSSIGKFGGDTDNWMWPRHTGDFSMFRIYADKDNNPADYSESNIPYTPKKFLTISRKGVQPGDFTMVIGYPGTTKEYVHSAEVDYVQNVSDPMKVDIRTQRLAIQKKYMSQDQKVRIQYSSKNASLANGWKKWKGEMGGLERNGIVERKREFEKGLDQWSAGTTHAGLEAMMREAYAKVLPLRFLRELYQETAAAFELGSFAASAISQLGDKGSISVDGFYKNWFEPIDKESFIVEMSEFGKRISEGMAPEYYTKQMQKYGTVEAWADALFSQTVFTSPQKVSQLVKDDIPVLLEDPVLQFSNNFSKWYREQIMPAVTVAESELASLNRSWMQAQMDYQPDKSFYPDANLTMRVAYGKVSGYSPSDGVEYVPVSMLKGIIEKDNPDIFDYNIPQILRDIYAEGGYERQSVCFLADNHTTGGNSGSPVLDAKGNLIGINFDRVWEGTMSDLAFDPSFCRNISLDVRYLLFVIEKIGKAGHLLDEMTFTD